MSRIVGYLRKLLVLLMVTFTYGTITSLFLDTYVGYITVSSLILIGLIFEMVGPELTLYFLRAKEVSEKSPIGQTWDNIVNNHAKKNLRLYLASELPLNIHHFKKAGRRDYYLLGLNNQQKLSNDDIRSMLELAVAKNLENNFGVALWTWLLFLPVLPISWLLPKSLKRIYVDYFLKGMSFFKLGVASSGFRYSSSSGSVIYKLDYEQPRHHSLFINYLLMETRCFSNDPETLPSILCERTSG